MKGPGFLCQRFELAKTTFVHPITTMLRHGALGTIAFWMLSHLAFAYGQDFVPTIQPFFHQYCNDCHADGAREGGLDLSSLGGELSKEQTFASWVRIYDRVLRW